MGNCFIFVQTDMNIITSTEPFSFSRHVFLFVSGLTEQRVGENGLSDVKIFSCFAFDRAVAWPIANAGLHHHDYIDSMIYRSAHGLA